MTALRHRRRAARVLARTWVDAAVDLVLPSGCAGCGAPGSALCRACVNGARGAPIRANRELRVGPLPPCVAVAIYADPLRSAVISFKDRGRRELAAPLGGLLARAVAGALDLSSTGSLPGAVTLVPVPSSRSAARSRGGDHVERLARSAVSVLAGARVQSRVAPMLVPARPVQDSVGLGPDARIANLVGAFSLRSGTAAPPGPVILVDDIVTTGATLAEATTTLRRAGVDTAGCAVIACVTRTESAKRLQIRGVKG